MPARGNGGAGEIIALGHLFGGMAELELEEKESVALANGSPASAALVADAAIAARGRLRLAEEVLALSAEALRAPLEAYAPELEELWGDEHEAAALRRLRELLSGGAEERRAFQAPVSYRILPRVLGQAHRALAEAERAATVSLSEVSDNPIFVPPSESSPAGRILSNGSFHNARAPAALDSLAGVWADLCQLAERHTHRLRVDPDGLAGPDVRPSPVTYLQMVQVAYTEEERLHAHVPRCRRVDSTRTMSCRPDSSPGARKSASRAVSRPCLRFWRRRVRGAPRERASRAAGPDGAPRRGARACSGAA